MKLPDDQLVAQVRQSMQNNDEMRDTIKSINKNPRFALSTLTAKKGAWTLGGAGMGMTRPEAQKLIRIAAQLK